MKILGINDHHNASVALLIDGKLVCAMQEERFAREKNFWGMPIRAIQAALDFAGIKIEDLDYVEFAGQRHSGHVNLTRDQHLALLKNNVQMDLVDSIRGRSSVPLLDIVKRRIVVNVRQRMKGWFYKKDLQKMQEERLTLLYNSFPGMRSRTIGFTDHHTCHYATAHYGAPKNDDPVLIFTNDNQGDSLAATVSVQQGAGQRKVLCEIDDRDSIGMLWAVVTLLMGFVPLEHEYKLMGMAPYASPEASKKVADQLLQMFEVKDGQYRLKKAKVQSVIDLQPVVEQLDKIMKFQRFDVVCGGLQLFTEEMMMSWVKYWINKTGIRKIRCAGGTFMNIKANKLIMECDEVEEIFVFPSCGDETNAIGACYHRWVQESKMMPEPLQSFYQGQDWSEEEIQAAIENFDTEEFEVFYEENIEHRIAEMLANEEIVARFKGREEFGARSLGNRSILANPSKWAAVSEINDMIKQRDFWMPFACSMLEEEKHRYLHDSSKNDGSYMIMAFQGGEEIDTIVAGTHPRDKTVRPQVVSYKSAPDYHRLISRFHELTGIGAVLNTSFNLHGWPLVHSPDDALSVLQQSGLKNLALGNFMLIKRSSVSIKRTTETVESLQVVAR